VFSQKHRLKTDLQDQISHSTSKAPFVKSRSLAKTSVSVSYDNILEKFPLGSSNLAFLFYYKYISHVQESNAVRDLLYGFDAITQGLIQSNSKLVVRRLTHHSKMAGGTLCKDLVQLRGNLGVISVVSVTFLHSKELPEEGLTTRTPSVTYCKGLKDWGKRGVSPHSLQQMLGAPTLVLYYFREKLHEDKTGNLYMPCPKKASDLPDPFASVLNSTDALHSLSCSPTLRRGP